MKQKPSNPNQPDRSERTDGIRARRSKKRVDKRRRKEMLWKDNPRLFLLYVVLRLLVGLTAIAQFLNRDYQNVFLCVVTLVLFTLPSFVERRLYIHIPDTLEGIILLFIFSAEILGEIREYYLAFPYWDAILHTLNGFLSAAVGFALVDILNNRDKPSFKLSPLFVALVSFCFSMTIGVVWEFFEFFMDVFFRTDMQKDTILPAISSVLLNPEGRNIPLLIDVRAFALNGADVGLSGYLDIGLYDTMQDLLVNFIGAVVFSTIGFFYISRRDNVGALRHLLPTRMSQEEIARQEGIPIDASADAVPDGDALSNDPDDVLPSDPDDPPDGDDPPCGEGDCISPAPPGKHG